jgi:hypothetical protein
MVRQDGKRNFGVRESDGSESSVFVGNYPRQAALKAARQLEPADTEAEADADRQELRLRERGTDKLHIYEAWAWEEDAPDDGPQWLSETVTEANVAKQGIEHLNE